MTPSRTHTRTSPAEAGKPAGKPRKLSRTHRPEHLSLEEWQVALRREYGKEQNFSLQNLGDQPVFSDFAVTNPETRRTYRVAIRGEELGINYCSCPDYATNTLGTCKHIEFTLGRLQKKASARRALARGYAPPFSEVYLRYGLQRKVVFSAGTEAPEALKELAADCFDEQGFLRDDAFSRFDTFLRAASHFDHELRRYDDTLSFIAEVRDAEHRCAHLDRKYGEGSSTLDELVKTCLYPYQREGVLFAARTGRSLLGDEMGLGKTVQAIAFVEILAREFGVERVLIICPASLKYQWKQEVEKFTDRTVIVLEGLSHLRREQYEKDSFFKIVNYDVIHRDLQAIARLSPDVVILDEAQRIKNWKTRAAQSVKSIESPYALVLTGTPLENRLEELHSIVQFVDRHRLGPLFRFLANHQVYEGDTARVVGYQNLSAIGETLKPILLRRKKAEVNLQLPERTDKNFFVPMTEQQWEPHEENQAIVARIVAKWRRHKFLSEADQRRLTIALQRMRMSCDNTYLIDQRTRFGPKADEVATLLGEVFEEPGSKVVVFSQWQRMNDLLAEELEKRDWGYVYLHGGVPSKDRRDLVASFREDPNVRVFLSTDAGGVGLNLQKASTIINVDLPWNPAVLEQRIGRVHRIGQHRMVRVVNYVSEGTIEHGMLEVLRFKKSLFAGVLDAGEDAVFLGGTRLNKFMESVESVSSSIPQTAHEPPASEEAEPLQEVEAEALALEPPPPSPLTETAAALHPVLTAGAAFLKELTDFVSANREPGKPLLASLSETDEKTGRAYLKLPLPEPEVVETMAAVVAPLVQLFQAAAAKSK